MMVLQFTDRLIPYNVFLQDIASLVVKKLKENNNDPEFVSQRKAYSMFGRANVERWRRQNKVKVHKRPGKVEYKTADLRFLQSLEQDYFKD